MYAFLTLADLLASVDLTLLFINTSATSGFSSSMAASKARWLATALWSNKMLMNCCRFGKSQLTTSSSGTFLASHPVPRPPHPFLKRFSPPPPMKRRWSRFQSFSVTALSIIFWDKFWGIVYKMPVVSPKNAKNTLETIIGNQNISNLLTKMKNLKKKKRSSSLNTWQPQCYRKKLVESILFAVFFTFRFFK